MVLLSFNIIALVDKKIPNIYTLLTLFIKKIVYKANSKIKNFVS